MKIEMKRALISGDLGVAHWDLGIVGTSLDERGEAAISFVQSNSSQVISLVYDADNFELIADGLRLNAENLDDVFSVLTRATVVLESTTLGFVELYLCCRSLIDLGVPRVDLLYVEPNEYTNPRRVRILDRRDFELTRDVAGYRAIPKATRLLSDRERQHVVFCLGYEERRLEVALEDYQMIGPDSCSLLFGVPAFKPGWEMNSFANNIRVIRDRKLRGGIHFCGAENPAATIQTLETIAGSLESGCRLFIAPVGTKPHGIGVALYASQHPECGLLYDHPVKKAKRSSDVSTWHLFSVEF